jgi:hypothetical protein
MKNRTLISRLLILSAVVLVVLQWQGCKPLPKTWLIDSNVDQDAISQLEDLIGAERLKKYAEWQRNQETLRGIELEKSWGVLTEPFSYAESKDRTDYFLTKHHPSSMRPDTIEKSVYHARSSIEAYIDTIMMKDSAAYPKREMFGYRMYFARYLNKDPKTDSTKYNKHTTIIRFTYDKEDIPHPAGNAYDVAVNLGNLCPPDCVSKYRPGGTGVYTNN